MLRRIDLRGFKSFAGATALEFGPGLNVIVGPNGSGKSNLAEAIVWAMGEQRAAKLRASGMSEVVFSGGAHRPPAGLAEVRLTLVDEEPADVGRPPEVEVTRRITRAGDAGYRLNGANCRLLDVHESLATRGLGPDALAVIRQGQVEAVCTARPGDIRSVLEEAAGVALSRRRRRRAESRLEKVAERLDRARDLQTELESRHTSLERQARNAERAIELDREIDAARRLAHRAAAHAAARALRDARRAQGEAMRARSEHAERARTAGQAADAAERAAEEARGRSARVEAARGAVRQSLQRTLDRHGFATERVRLADERARSKSAEAAEAARARRELVAQRDAARDALGRAEVADADARAERDAAAEAAARHADAAGEAARAASEWGAVADQHRADADRAERRRAAARQAHERATAQHDSLVARTGGVDLARLARRAEVADGRAERWAQREEAARDASADARSSREGLDDRRRTLRRDIDRLAVRAPSEGLGAKVRVEPGFEDAMGAALGDLAGAPWASGLDPALAAVHEGSRFAVIPAPPRPLGAPAGARPLVDVVTGCPDEVRPYLEQVLEGCFVVDALESVPAGARGVFVTPDGDLMRPASGVVTHGDGDWARGARRAALDEELAGLDGEVAVADRRVEEARDALRRVQRRAAAARTSATTAQRALAAARGKAAGEARALAEAVERQQSAVRELAEAERLVAEVAAAAPAGDAGDDLRARADAARAEAARHADAHAAAHDAAVHAQAALAAARVRDAELAARDAALERASDPGAPVDLEPARRALASLEAAAAALGRRAEALDAAVRGDAERSAVAERERNEARAVAGRAREALRAAEATVHEAELRTASAGARADQLGPAEGDDPGDVDLAAQEALVEGLERRRRAIGTVNELAAAECEELAERITETAEQIQDLEQAAQAIRSHLGELDDAVAAGFDEVFQAVRTRFEDMIAALFPGGEGRLAVIGDDEDPGVEIQVVPAGKRPRPLALLSGGERTLVALAFCLAIATARPAPFYLLDEVEAALDDTNLRRLLAVVRRLSDHTQFIMITHQQPTVEMADTLFGVTMAADGVSNVVARRLDRGVDAARPFVRRQLTAIQGGRA